MTSIGLRPAVLFFSLTGVVDFSGVIARSNVNHSWEVGGAGEPVDAAYLCGLGPAALPALDMLTAKTSVSGRRLPGSAYNCRRSLELRHAMRMEDWRAWTFRGYRLKRLLDERDARRGFEFDVASNRGKSSAENLRLR
jgi:hypothetical protein